MSRFSREERVVLGALTLIVVAMVLRAWAVLGSWFYSDDFIFLGDVASGDARGGWFLEPHNVHFMPFSRWLTWLVGHAGEYPWWAAATQILVLQALAALTCWWMLRTLFGDRPGVLAALAVYLFAPATMPTVVWWAAAINQLPHQIALMGAIACHVKYLRDPSWSRALTTGAFLVLGYASYTKSVLIPVVLLALTFVHFAWGPLVLRLRTTVGAYFHAWFVLGGLSVAYVFTYLTIAPESPLPAWSVLVETADLSVVQSAVPSLLGGPWQWQTLGQPGGVGPRLFVDAPLMLSMLAWVGLFAGTVWQSLRYRRAWWPLVLVVGYALLSALVIAVGRATAFGPESAALELRYFADLAVIGALALGLVTMPMVRAPFSLERRSEPLVRVRTPRRWVVGGAVVVLGSSLLSSILYVLPWHDSASMPQEAYLAAARNEAAALESPVLDTGVPDEVLWSAAFPKNLTSRVLSPVLDSSDFTDEGVDLRMFARNGELVRAVVAGGARNQPGPVEDCGFLVEPEPEDDEESEGRQGDSTVDIPINPVFDFPFMVGINYLASDDARVRITAGSVTRTLDLDGGLHVAFLPSAGAYETLTVEHVSGSAVCVDSVAVGAIEPITGPELP